MVALGMLQAELLHLNFDHARAVGVLQDIVSPHLSALMPEERFAVEQNLSDLQFYESGRGADLLYNVVDQKRLAHFEWLDYRDLFSAKQEAERGKHYETLPILWQQHRRAYLHGCWLAQRWTNQLLAKECVALKAWEDAVHHALLAQDDEVMPDIARGILSTLSVELVGQVVNRLIKTANLRRHFVVACKLLKALADAVPDAWVRPVGEWLLGRAREVRVALIGPNHVSEAWETITAVAGRFPSDLARSAIAAAVAHPAFTSPLPNANMVIPERKDIVQALVPLAWAVPVDDIPALAAATLPLLTDRPQMADYNDVVNLLCHLAERGGADVRDKLASAMYPAGQPVSRVLAQVADQFGKGETFDPGRVQGLSDQVAREIRHQVQMVGQGQKAEPIAEQIIAFTSPKSEGTLQVSVVGLTGLHALAKHRTKLGEPTKQNLFDAILDMAQHRDNFCVNRKGLLHALIEFVDVVPEAARGNIEGVLARLARGQVEESLEYPRSAQADDPLNPFKYNYGRPEDVQAMALIVIAALASGNAAATRRAGELLEDALCDPRPAIRRAAYASARRLTDVSGGVILGVLAGLRDPDPNVAVMAFAALADQTGWDLNRNHWRVFLMAARLAQRTGDPNLRRHAAAALAAWAPKCPPQFEAEKAELLTAFRDDICLSVRSVVNRQSEGG
jgi:hypothetical protein